MSIRTFNLQDMLSTHMTIWGPGTLYRKFNERRLLKIIIDIGNII